MRDLVGAVSVCVWVCVSARDKMAIQNVRNIFPYFCATSHRIRVPTPTHTHTHRAMAEYVRRGPREAHTHTRTHAYRSGVRSFWTVFLLGVCVCVFVARLLRLAWRGQAATRVP